MVQSARFDSIVASSSNFDGLTVKNDNLSSRKTRNSQLRNSTFNSKTNTSQLITSLFLRRKMTAMEPATCLSSFRGELQKVNSTDYPSHILMLIQASFCLHYLFGRIANCVAEAFEWCRRERDEEKKVCAQQKTPRRPIGNLFKSKWSRIERNDLLAWYAK